MFRGDAPSAQCASACLSSAPRATSIGASSEIVSSRALLDGSTPAPRICFEVFCRRLRRSYRFATAWATPSFSSFNTNSGTNVRTVNRSARLWGGTKYPTKSLNEIVSACREVVVHHYGGILKVNTYTVSISADEDMWGVGLWLHPRETGGKTIDGGSPADRNA